MDIVLAPHWTMATHGPRRPCIFWISTMRCRFYAPICSGLGPGSGARVGSPADGSPDYGKQAIDWSWIFFKCKLLCLHGKEEKPPTRQVLWRRSEKKCCSVWTLKLTQDVCAQSGSFTETARITGLLYKRMRSRTSRRRARKTWLSLRHTRAPNRSLLLKGLNVRQ